MMVYIPYIITLFIIYLIFDGHKPDGFLVIPTKARKKINSEKPLLEASGFNFGDCTNLVNSSRLMFPSPWKNDRKTNFFLTEKEKLRISAARGSKTHQVNIILK